VDPHIPLERVHESSRSLSNLGGAVEERVYPGMGHTINEDEIKHVQSLLTQQVSVSVRLAGAEQIDPPVRQFKR
jgi:predicted esterase